MESARVDPSAQSLQGYSTSRVAERPAGVVYAAAVVTWIGATGTAALSLFVAVGLLLVLEPVFDAFDGGPDNPRWFVAGVAAVARVPQLMGT